ncbi:MAG: hypothetical protein KC503_27315, partial [Myxococcales bacterium]|nr:hypothetical protein [Myxococcales bacterium]
PEPPALRALGEAGAALDGGDTQVSPRPPTGPQQRRPRQPSREARAAVKATQARRKRPTLQGLPVLKAPHVSTTGDDVLAPTPATPNVDDRFVRKPRRPSTRELAVSELAAADAAIEAAVQERMAALDDDQTAVDNVAPVQPQPQPQTARAQAQAQAQAQPPPPPPPEPEPEPYKPADKSKRDDSKVVRLDDLRGKPPRRPTNELPPAPAGWAPSARGLAAKLTQVIAKLRHADSENEAARATLDFVGIVCERRALLRIKRGVLSGWAAAGNRLDSRSIRGLWLPVDPASVFGNVVTSRMPYQGPLGYGKAERIFASFIGKHPDDILLVPVTRDDQVVALIYGDSRVVDIPMALFRDLAAELALADRRLRK